MLPEDFSLEGNTDLQILFFDVGQADSILVSDNGKNMLIDAGNYEDGKYISEYLKQLGINKIDYLIGTHAHEDHIGGMHDIINNFDIEYLMMPEVSEDVKIKAYNDMKVSMEEKNLPLTLVAIGDVFVLGDAECKVKFVDNEFPENKNNSSIIIEISLEEQDYLFMGDSESVVENNKIIDWKEVEVLKVGHHGSETSSKDRFLKMVSPEIAVITVGTDNIYNLPKETVINRLRNFCGENIFRTDINGTIYMKNIEGKNIVQFLETNIDGNRR